jgi:hypothetical protein
VAHEDGPGEDQSNPEKSGLNAAMREVTRLWKNTGQS